MVETTKIQQNILRLFLNGGSLQSSDVFELIKKTGEVLSLISVKRNLSEMLKLGILSVSGLGRSTSYKITTLGRIFCDINPKTFVNTEPDRRSGLDGYNFELFNEFPFDILDPDEKNSLELSTNKYEKRVSRISSTIREKELQRMVIELSWKSSKIEGNTYTLLDTERLILEVKEAPGHDKDEARMILNHKDAFKYIHENSKEYKKLSLSNLQDVHSILVKDLGVRNGLRNTLVGITGSKYKPLDNAHQIREAVENLSISISKSDNPYTKAVLALLGISYIQPFEDGNKQTGRLMANAILLAHGCAPLSYRSVVEEDYRNAVLVFYETNSIIPFKNIFIEQYLFAAENYAV